MQKQYPLLIMAIAVVACVLAISMTAVAQEMRSEISIQGTGFFTKSSSGRGIHQDTTDTGGVLGTYRYHLHSWLSAEAAYGWNRNTQVFFAPAGLSRIQADLHQATGGFVINLPTHHFWVTPYALVEGGALVFDPTNNSFGSVAGAQRDVEGVFVYGAGADVASLVFRRIALRVEYRGLVYHAPNFGFTNLNTNAVAHTAVPSVGIVYKF